MANYLFTRGHEWLSPRGRTGLVGISDYAQEALGDIVFVIVPSAGQIIQSGKCLGTVESIKAVSDVDAPVTCRVISSNQELRLKPATVNSDPYRGGWFAEIEILDPDECRKLMNVFSYRADYLQEVEHILFLDEENRIHYLRAIRGDDGKIIVHTDSFREVLSQSYIRLPWSSAKAVIEEFEELINRPKIKEQALQEFFERFPEFLLGGEHETAHPHVRLKPQVMIGDEEQDLIPDFILKPIAGMTHEPSIVELKLPTVPIIKSTPRRERLYDSVAEAVAQLKTYARYFEQTENREYVRKVLGFTAYRPRLVLVVGKTISVGDEKLKADILSRSEGVEIRTYQDILYRYKKLTNS
ncbi:MAG: glycine cleavage system protein GcvH [Terracidiphilus sp.]